MLEILKTVTMSPAQYEMVIEGMRNSYDSWDRSDSYKTTVVDKNALVEVDHEFFIGENDLTLMNKLAAAGSPHAKYRRMMPVWVTIKAPLYWWKQFDTYRTGIAPNPTDIEENSCSSMHRITAKEYEVSDFSQELLCEADFASKENGTMFQRSIRDTIRVLNEARIKYIESNKDPRYFNAIIQLLPESYNQRRTIMLNYQALSDIYKWRKNHKLGEWRTLCKWIESLPYSELITGENSKEVSE